MVAARASIICYYDLISPYTFMGVKLFQRYRKQWPTIDVTYKPMLLGGIMNAIKNKPLIEFPSKRNHMIADLDRISVVTGVPFHFPENFPVNTVLPMRVLTALQQHEAKEKYEECMDKDEYFIHGRNISQAEVIQAALGPLLDLSSSSSDRKTVDAYLQLATQPEIKQLFKDNTDGAVARGVFGAPTFIVHKEGEREDKEHLFFGSDRFEMIAAFLGLPYPGLIPRGEVGIGEITPKL
ncbi:Glutathione S-transferase kappa 1 [Mortierella claussenii]|nr:Glutathione S-transferase kappa 1 [Mortierella claussenii]